MLFYFVHVILQEHAHETARTLEAGMFSVQSRFNIQIESNAHEKKSTP